MFTKEVLIRVHPLLVDAVIEREGIQMGDLTLLALARGGFSFLEGGFGI